MIQVANTGVTVWSSRQISRHSTENRRKALQEAIRAAQAVLLIVSPEARSLATRQAKEVVGSLFSADKLT